MSEPTKIQRTPHVVTKKLVYILDNEVVLVVGTDDRNAAIFQSNPTIVEYANSAENIPQVGWKWDGTNFTPPVSE